MSRKTEGQEVSVLRWSIFLTCYYLIASIFFQDVALHDESTFYLSQKDRLSFSSFLTGAEYGPLYGGWYKALSMLFTDNIALYFASWALLVVLSIELMRRATRATASVFPLLITLALPIFKVSPYIGLFSSVVILAGYIQKNTEAAIVSIAVSGLVAGLARPEFLYAPAILLIGCVAYRLLHKQPQVKTILACVLLAALALFISRSSDTGRGAVAFEQHYNLRASEKGQIGDQNPWTSKHAREVFFKNGDRDIKHTLGDYVRANPGEVAAHVFRNVTDPRTLLLALACVGVAFALYKAGQFQGAMYVAAMGLPPVISCVLVYPRNHYVVSILLTLIAGASLVLAPYLSGADRIKRFRTPALMLLAAMVVLFSLNIHALRSPPKGFAEHGFAALHPITSTILEMRKLERDQPANKKLTMFEPYGGINIYLQRDWRRIAEYDVKSKSELLDMIQRHDANVFIADSKVLGYLHVSKGELEQAFASGGYASKACTYLECTIYMAPN